MRRSIQEKREALRRYLSSELLSFGQLRAIFLPVLWEQAFLALLALMNLAVLRGDADAVSAVNMMGVVHRVFTSLCLGLACGGTVLVAQNTGAGRTAEAGDCTVRLLLLAAGGFTALGGLLLWLRAPLVGYLLAGAGDAVGGQASLYFAGFCLSLPFYAVLHTVAGCMRGRGETRLAWRVTLVTNGAELLLTVVLVSLCGMGVCGAAAAMVASRVLGAAAALFLLVRRRQLLGLRRPATLLPDRALLRMLLAIALPLALEQFFFNGGKAFSQRFIAGYGTAHMAANGIVNALFDVINLPQVALRETLVTVVGMCIGCGRVDLARRYIYRFLRTIRVSIVLLAPLTIPFCAAYIALCALPGASTRLTMACLALLYTFGPLYLGGSFTVPAGLRAGGDAGFVSGTALACMWGVRVTLSWLFAGVLHMGVVGLNLAMVLEWLLRSHLFRLRLAGERWHSHVLVPRSEAV